VCKVPLVAIVDDDVGICEALSELLLVLGLACRTFAQAEALLEAHQPGVFDCIITDVRMPGMSGLELLQRLRSLDASVPVIMITSDTDPLTRSRAVEAGVHAYLAKPVADHVLIRHLESALDRDVLLGDGNMRKGSSDA
jgi:two-component system, LuxR family, response regulator FixJ